MRAPRDEFGTALPTTTAPKPAPKQAPVQSYNPLTGIVTTPTPPPAPASTPAPAPAEPAQPTGRVAANEARKAAGPPYPAPSGYHWSWIGTEYKLYQDSAQNVPPAGGDASATSGATGSDATLISTETDDFGNVIGFYSDGTSKTLVKSGRTTKTTVDEDAYALLEQTFKDYGLDELVPVIKGYMDRNLGANQAALELRKEPVYQQRFKGNETRRAVGLNVLSEAEYLALEDSYSQTLRAYGLQNYFGADSKSKQKAMADIIGNDISATEFKDRIDTVVTRVQNSDPSIKSTLRSFYNITDEDIVSYFLNPKDNLLKLQEKVTSAEIGAAAKGQGLMTSAEAATALAQFGVTREKAQEGYQAIGSLLPTATKLGEIYGDQYTQATAEEEVFKGLASAQRKRQKLASLEEAQFGGSSGRMRNRQSSGNQGAF
jgi:hypothetical protein